MYFVVHFKICLNHVLSGWKFKGCRKWAQNITKQKKEMIKKASKVPKLTTYFGSSTSSSLKESRQLFESWLWALQWTWTYKNNKNLITDECCKKSVIRRKWYRKYCLLRGEVPRKKTTYPPKENVRIYLNVPLCHYRCVCIDKWPVTWDPEIR